MNNRQNEIQLCLAAIQEAYPHFLDGRTMQQTVALWDKFFQEPKDAILAAIAAFIASDTKGFPPNIGQIKEKIAQMRDDIPDETQAWAIVCRAMEHPTRKTFATLPPLIQQCVGSPETLYEWGNMDLGTVDSVIAASFMRTYRAKAQKQREYGKLPEFAKPAFATIEGQRAYSLPPPREVVDEVDERVGPPENVLKTVNQIKAGIDRSPRAIQDLKDQASRNKAFDDVMDALLKGGKA